MGKNRYPNFRGLLTAEVVKSHVKLHVKTDVQKMHCDIVAGNSSGLQPRRIIKMYLYLLSRQVPKGKLIQIFKDQFIIAVIRILSY